ncbi:alpha/beta hydrolase [Ekhidna sp.]
MKTIASLFLVLGLLACNAQKMSEQIEIESRITGLKLCLTHLSVNDVADKPPVLLIHGASFPTNLASGFEMDGLSWIEFISKQGHDVYALDFLGYGCSDRYSKMNDDADGDPLGMGEEVAYDIHQAVKYILAQNENFDKINLIGHSWGASVSGYYTSLYPKTVDKLVLFAPFVRRDGPLEWERPDYRYIDLTPEKRIKQFSKAIPQGETTLHENIHLEWGAKWLQSDLTSKKRLPRAVRYPAGWKLDLYNCWNGSCFFDPKKIKTHTLVIRGEWDTVLNSKDADYLIDELKNVASIKYIILKKSTHVAHLEKNRYELYREVEEFLSFKFKK